MPATIVLVLAKHNHEVNSQLLELLSSVTECIIFVIRDTDLQVANLYRQHQVKSVLLAINGDSSSVIFGKRLVQDSLSYSLAKGCLKSTDMIKQVQDLFDMPVTLSVMNAELDFKAAEKIEGEILDWLKSIENLVDFLEQLYNL